MLLSDEDDDVIRLDFSPKYTQNKGNKNKTKYRERQKVTGD